MPIQSSQSPKGPAEAGADRAGAHDLFENAFHHAPIGMALVGLDGRFLRVNAALCTLVGYNEAQFLALDFQSITHPEDLDTDLGLLAQLVAGILPRYEMDKRYQRADGSLVWVRLSVSLVLEADGSPKHFISQLQDLTVSREAEARYRILAENVSDMVALHDGDREGDGRCLYMSPSSERIIGYTPEEVMVAHPADLVPVEDNSVFSGTIRDFRKQPVGSTDQQLIRMRRKDGKAVWVEVNRRLARDLDGKIIVVAASRDVSARVEAQDALEQKSKDLEIARQEALAAKAAAETATAVKSEFLANMSHEIRTPLTSILGFTGLLERRAGLDATAQGYVERVASSSRALLAIVNDVLDFSKLEAGHVEINAQAVAPVALAREVVSMFAPQAETKGLALELQIEGALPDWVLMDPDRLRQVLVNLMGNALKFTEHGQVQLHIAYEAADERLTFAVRDTGPGLNRTQQRKLFQRFSQVDASSARRHGGTGLGLAICKGLVEAMGGQIGVSARLGEGSQFHFWIAAPTVEAQPAASEPQSAHGDLEGVRVLVVDDNRANRELARILLETWGAQVADAADGQAGVAAASAQPYDVILMDIRMPVMDGPAALLRIRSTEGPNRFTPILAFSADADLERFSGLDQGFEDTVAKPIDPLALYTTLSLWTPKGVISPSQRSAGKI